MSKREAFLSLNAFTILAWHHGRGCQTQDAMKMGSGSETWHLAWHTREKKQTLRSILKLPNYDFLKNLSGKMACPPQSVLFLIRQNIPLRNLHFCCLEVCFYLASDGNRICTYVGFYLSLLIYHLHTVPNSLYSNTLILTNCVYSSQENIMELLLNIPLIFFFYSTRHHLPYVFLLVDTCLSQYF